ncbi:MAG TPA: CbiX/SirB N-terminal domain-containing protein [Rhodocyclaceae bacterium]|nr:CbiX/SirB N-terminal domain-containing protein [Rhodocyclaceae bacterium]
MAVALILFAHGARDPAWAEPVRRVQAAIRAIDPRVRVEAAFLELMTPSLADCGAALAAEGFERVVVLPMFIAQSGHLKRDVPEILAVLQARFPAVRFELAQAVGENEAMIRAMAEAGLSLLAGS